MARGEVSQQNNWHKSETREVRGAELCRREDKESALRHQRLAIDAMEATSEI